MLVVHLVEKAEGERKLLGAEAVSNGDVVGVDGRGVAGDVVHPVEQGKGAAVVGVAREESDHEAQGELFGGLVRGRFEERGEKGVELRDGGGLGKGEEEGGEIDRVVDEAAGTARVGVFEVWIEPWVPFLRVDVEDWIWKMEIYWR